MKIGLEYADPISFLALRYLCVVALLLLPAIYYRKIFPTDIRTIGHIAMVGLLIQACYFSFVYLSLKWGISAGAVSLIVSQQPILIALLAPAIAGEKVSAVHWLGLALGVSGAALVTLSRSSVAVGSGVALVCAVLALLSMTSGTLWEKRFGVHVHPVASNMIQYIVGLAVTAPLAYALEPMHFTWTSGLFISLIYLVICNSLIAISLLLAMFRYGEASRASALFFLVPPATAVIAYVTLGEELSLLAWGGMLLAVTGLFLVTRTGYTGKARPK